MPIPFCSGLRLSILLLALACGAPARAVPISEPGAQAARVDPLEASMAGEFALQSGLLAEAARDYLAAARAAADPVLAERATRIALLADRDALAAEALAAWRQLQPQDSQTRHMLAATLALRAGKKSTARRELRQLLTAPDGWQAALAALTGAIGQRQPLVVAMLEEIVARGELPAQLQAWLAFGGLAQRLEQPKLVDRIIAQLVARFPNEPQVALLRAQWLREAGAVEQAHAVLDAVPALAWQSTALRSSLASEYEALGDAARAAQVLASGPQDDSTYARRADLLDALGDKEALAALYAELKSGATQPNPMRRLLLGQVAELLQRYDEALAWYASVPGSRAQALARLRAVGVRHAMGQKAQAYAEARALQSDASLDDTARRDGYLLEAELRQKDGDVAAERDAYARGLAAFPDNLELLYARALMWERQDQIDRAEADLRRILVIAPDNVAALNALGYTLADRTNRYREALELIDRARVADPGNAAIIDSYGWVLFKLGKPREALEQLRRAYALQKDPDIASHLGQVLWVLGRRDEARRYFDEARKLDPNNRALQRALRETGA
ncbi:tetratricopeptide repeat protein [Thermomonas alba]|uniref:tetratricopeptide repeat protein n=1 Tax=Thermomonas alba TaxID=2888525 RepID=UPI001F038AAB|nr:tetratricopeptide repeat protein [Thermomonas alba]